MITAYSLDDVVTVPCPACGASVGQLCHSRWYAPCGPRMDMLTDLADTSSMEQELLR